MTYFGLFFVAFIYLYSRGFAVYVDFSLLDMYENSITNKWGQNFLFHPALLIGLIESCSAPVETVKTSNWDFNLKQGSVVEQRPCERCHDPC